MTGDHGQWRRTPGTVCHRALLDGNCTYGHRWVDGVPFGLSDHQTFTRPAWVDRAARRTLPVRVEGGTYR